MWLDAVHQVIRQFPNGTGCTCVRTVLRVCALMCSRRRNGISLSFPIASRSQTVCRCYYRVRVRFSITGVASGRRVLSERIRRLPVQRMSLLTRVNPKLRMHPYAVPLKMLHVCWRAWFLERQSLPTVCSTIHQSLSLCVCARARACVCVSRGDV